MSDVKRLGSVGTDDDGKCAAERETTEMKDEDTEMIDKQAEFVEFQGKVFEGLTDDQKKAVYTDGKVLVTAAAGTGKTRSMIGRIVGKVMKGVPIRRILVLVFNEAAAAEIKERLHSALFDAACTATGEMGRYLRDSIDDLSGARIGTIDSFCRSVVKENFERLGISPNFDVIGAETESAYVREALDEVFAEYAAAGDEVFMQLSDILSPSREEEDFRACIKGLHDLYEIFPDGEEFLAGIKRNFGTGEAFLAKLLDVSKRGLARVAEVCRACLAPLADDGQNSYVERTQDVVSYCEACLAGGAEELSRIAASYELTPAKKKVRVDTPEVEVVKVAVKRFVKIMSDWESYVGNADRLREELAQNSLYAAKLCEITVALDEKLCSRKFAEGVMSYADLERYAVKLVKEGCDLASKFDCVFVDEYQDVNRLQEFLIDSLVREDAFMVGDVKQSIYGFRLADPTVFLEKGRQYAAGAGKLVGFRQNFRSEDSILKFVNAVFDSAMTDESADIDYRRDGRFEVPNENSVNVGDNVQVHLFALEGLRSERSREEGRFIAREIKRLLGKAVGKDGKRLGYGDFVVLFRSRGSSAQYVLEGMREENVPIDDSNGFSSGAATPERDLINFLRVLDNPRQDIPLAGFMLSYFGAFSEAELAEIAEGRTRQEDLYDAVLRAAQRDDSLGRKTAAMLDMLADYRLRASFRSVPELVRTIIADFSFDAYAESLGDGQGERVRSFAGGVVTGDFAFGIGRFLEVYERGAGKEKDGTTGGDKVHVSTFHGYKGLEAPVVFVAGTQTRRNRNSVKGDVLRDSVGGIGLKFYDILKRTSRATLSLGAVKEFIQEREAKEEMRLFYVALTRARNYLYVTGSPSDEYISRFGTVPPLDRADCPLDYLSEAVCKGTLSVFVAKHTEAGGAALSSGRVFPVMLPEGSDDDVRAVGDAVAYRYPYETATKTAGKYSVSALDGIDDETVGVFSDKADEGTLYHRVMEEIDFSAEGVEGVLEEFARMKREGYFTEEELESVDPAAIARCLATPEMRAARSSVCYREKPFLMTMTARDAGQGDSDDKVVVQGVIDLVIDGDERILVDFKNSALRSAEAMEKYKKQLKLYKKAVETALLAKVDRTLLYSFKLGKFVEIV